MERKINLYFLTKITENKDDLIRFCSEIKLIPTKVKSPCCKRILKKPYIIEKKDRSFQEIRYQCNKRLCRGKAKRNSISFRKYTWFEGARVSLQKSLFLTYCFVYQMSYKDTIRETSIEIRNILEQGEKQVFTSSETVSDYKRYCRDVCINVLLDSTSQQIGGPGLIVEIDESKFGKMKYHRGRKVDGQWVFGAICRETKEFFLVPVVKRNKETLLPIILERIRHGSTIISDCWSAYQCLSCEDYNHLTVNHTYHFVDPETLAHTQNIECLWWQVKRQLPETYTRHDQLYLHLCEYMWRVLRKDSDDIFISFLQDASRYFPGKVRS